MNKLITKDYFSHCKQCNSVTNMLYANSTCSYCMGSVPGAGYYEPCKICVPPNINWFYKETYGHINKSCKIHRSLTSDSDSNLSFSIFD
jgi:hypothetical protein